MRGRASEVERCIWEHDEMALMRSDGIPSLVLGRPVFVLLGVLWAVRSLQSFTDPNFTDPAGASDWLAVVGVSLGLALLPVGLVLLLGLSRCGGRISRVLLVIAALGAVVAAIANFVEVGLGVEAAGSVYYVAISLMMLTLLGLAAFLAAGHPRWPAVVVFGTLIGLVLLESGGGVLILVVWAAAAIAVPPRTNP